MRQISNEVKAAIIRKALSRDGRCISEIAKSNNIARSTLFTWLKNYEAEVKSGKINNQKISSLTVADKFNHLIATANLDEVSLGTYCREQGIYSFQLQQWKKDFMTQSSKEKTVEKAKELKLLRDENTLLKQELRRKDSALAEATALLVLKKKAALIWGEIEAD